LDNTTPRTEVTTWNPSVSRDAKLLDKSNNTRIQAAFTDGGHISKENKTASGLTWNKESTVWQTLVRHTSFNAEIEAIEAAFATSGNTGKTIVFTDSASSIAEIKNTSQRRIYHNKNRAAVSRIHALQDRRAREGLGEVELVWIPSHTLNNANKASKPAVKAQVKYLEERFGKVAAQGIISGNDRVDRAITRYFLNSQPNPEELIIPEGAQEYAIVWEDKFFEGNIGKHIKAYLREAQWNKYLKQSRFKNHEEFNIPLSNQILLSNQYQDLQLQNFLIKLRVLALCTPERQFFRYSNSNSSWLDTRRKCLYPDPECYYCQSRGFCKIANLFHLWKCPSNIDIINTTIAKINTEAKKLNPRLQMQPWFPKYTPKARTPTRVPPPTTSIQPAQDSNILTEVLKITSKANLRRQQAAKTKWTTDKYKEWKSGKDNQGPDKQTKKRSVLGYLPNHIVEQIETAAKEAKKDTEAAKELCLKLNRIVIETSKKLYNKMCQDNFKQRKEEGVSKHTLKHRASTSKTPLSAKKLQIHRKNCKDCKWRQKVYCPSHSEQ